MADDPADTFIPLSARQSVNKSLSGTTSQSVSLFWDFQIDALPIQRTGLDC